MRLFRKVDHTSYYYRFVLQARLIATIGAVVFTIACSMYYTGTQHLTLSILIIGGIGAIILMFGGINLRPNVLLSSFAKLLIYEPSRKNAQEFIMAINCTGKVYVLRKTRKLIDRAVEVYGKCSERDAVLLKQIEESRKRYLRTRII